MLLGIKKTDKKLPINRDFLFAFVQAGETFGETMVEGFAWRDENNGILDH